MSKRFPSLLLALLALGATIGCESARITVGGPSPVAASLTAGTTFNFEPATLRAEFIPGISCIGSPAFGTQVIVIVGGESSVILNGLRFRYTDRFGVTAFPNVAFSPAQSTGSTIPLLGPIPIPATSPIPMPGTSPISIPGASPLNDLALAAGTSRLCFLLRFDCGVASQGTLLVQTTVSEANGKTQSSEYRVRVGS